MNEPAEYARQVLSATTRKARETDDLDDDVLEVRAAKPATGKQTRVTAGDAASPGMPERVGPRIDRRATADDDVDEGSLASAFEFISQAGHGTSLPEELALRLQRELGVDMQRVRIHTDAHAAAAAATLSARAFTIGEDIYFAAGAYEPSGEAGIQLIAHEMAHVAENQRGVAATSDKVSRPDDQHERRADEFAAQFGQRQSRFETTDRSELLTHLRTEGRRRNLPFTAELEERLGSPLDFIAEYTDEAALLANGLMAAGAYAVRSVIGLADASPQREELMTELNRVVERGDRAIAQPHPVTANIATGTIHRKKTDPAPATPAAAGVPKDEIKKFIKGLTFEAKREPKDPVYGVEADGGIHPRYYVVTEAFAASEYVNKDKAKRKDADLTGLSDADAQELRLHKVDGGKYIVSKGADEFKRDLIKKKPLDTWKDYRDALDKLKAHIKPFTWSAKAYKDTEPALTAKENKAFREDMRTAIATAFQDKTGKFNQLYTHVVEPGLFASQRITGDIFEECAILSAARSKGADPDQPVFDKEDFGNELPEAKVRVLGDGTIKSKGVNAIVECKAYVDGAPTGEIKKQMDTYGRLLNKTGKGVTGYKIKGEVQTTYLNHVVYMITTPFGKDKDGEDKREAALKKWMAAFAKSELKWGQYSLIPPPKGYATKFKVKYNPEFEFTIPEGQKSINLSNPQTGHPGMDITKLSATLDDSLNVTSGSVTYDVAAADIKKKAITKPITPSKGAEIGGQVDNKVTGLTSKLSEILPVDIDAAIIDGGVEATIKLKAGAAKGLAGFEVEAAEIKATYTGTLAIATSITLKHKNGKIRGTVKVSYDGGWAFSGTLNVSEGFIPGVASFSIGVSKNGAGEWKISSDEIKLEKQFGAIKLTATGSDMEYDVTKGSFKGDLALDADLGMFGTASGRGKIEDNKLKSASISYDSPELKYPKDKPVIVGTVGGTVKFNDGKFSGDIRGSATLNIPALQKIAKEGVGLDVDAHIGEDGSYSGTIKSTKPITIGKHLKIPSVGITLEKDGSLKGDFELEIVNIKGVSAKAKGTVDKSGVHITDASATVSFGNPEGKFWGSITAKYTDAKGFDVEGTANYKIKDGLTATGIVKYTQETNAISVELKTTEITLLEKEDKKQLFKASKQFPIVNVYGLGIYVDIGFDLGFDFGFKITMAPSVKVEDFSLETLEFKRIAAKLEVGGNIFAQLTGTPKLGLGVFALDPSILRGGGGLKVPITGRLEVKPKATFEVGYSPDGGADASAKLGISGEFGIKGSVSPYAEFSVLNAWNPTWEGQPLAAFEILKPQELFNFTVDLNSKEKQADPELPGQNAAKTPSEPEGDKTAKAAPASGAGGSAETAGGSKDTPAKQGEAPSGGDDGPFSLTALMGKLETMPGFATAKKIFEYGKKIWAVVKPIWDIVSPLMNIIAKRIEEVIGLFDPGPSEDGLGEWLWKLAKLLFNLSFGGIVEVASAIKTLLSSAVDFGKKLINKAVQDGHIGVKRHSYYIWRPWPMDDYEFMAAAEWKINIPGVANLGEHEAPGFLLTPSGAAGLVLYEALGLAGVGYTYTGKSNINQPYNDRWTGAGARG